VHYIYDLDGHLIAEADGATGQTLREYIWLASNDNEPVDLPLGLVTGVNTATPVTTLVHADHLGRPIRMTNAARATVWQASYTPFGEPQTISGSIEQNLRFPGQFFLIETSLAYNWHRHYDPSTGRYTQPDPLRFVDGPSVYAYVGGSPFMHSDRAGLFDKGFADGGTTWGHSDFPGSSSIGGSGHGPFDYNREDTDPATEPYNWPEGTARHFRELPAIEADMRTAIMICNILWFERLMHQGQDYFVHARNGYGAWFGHLYAGHGPDHDDSAWAEAALWSYVWWQRWVNRCDCK
jgi:RHS repeat-associated protein